MVVLGAVLAMSLAIIVSVACVVPALLAIDIGAYASGEVTFTATELLGRPTDRSVTINVVAEEDLEVYFEYGTQSGIYTNRTSVAEFLAGEPIEVVIDGLQSNTRYYYRMVYRKKGATSWIWRDEHSFHTQRARGSTFTFTVTSDSHLGFPPNLGNATLYRRTLLNVLNDKPDFHIDLGDTFPMANVKDTAGARQVYLAQRPYLGLISHSVPIFLVIGNHENEEGWNLDDTPSQPLLSVNARKRYYPNPVPNRFYSGNTDPLPWIDDDHLREDYYAWQWGDALFVVLDPFWYTMTKPYAGAAPGEPDDEKMIGDRWDWTLGWRQYQWFKRTLQSSNATFKFVFAHHVTGGTQPYGRGGAAAAPYFEWGGLNVDNTWGFNVKRPRWDKPIHQLMVENNVTIFFHGHDHFFAKEEKDGIIYQGCPMPSDASYGTGFYNSAEYPTGVILPNSGHLRITVSPSQVTVEYVQAYLSGSLNGQVAYTYTIMANSSNNLSTTPSAPPSSSSPSNSSSQSSSSSTLPSPSPSPNPSPPPSPLPSPSPPPSPAPPPSDNAPPINMYLLIAAPVVIAAATIAAITLKKSKKPCKKHKLFPKHFKRGCELK